MRRAWGVFITVILCLGLLPSAVAAGNFQTFPQTGQVSENAFYDFWLAHGQLTTLGLPVSPTYVTVDRIVTQIYERAILEWHPENTHENRVQVQRLGDEALDDIVTGPDDKTPTGDIHRHEPPRKCSGDDCETFTATNHTVQGGFRDFWYANGGLATFGYPLTEEFSLTTFDGGGKQFTVQYFERNRFEWHPEINGGTVLLGRLGARIWDDLRTRFTGRANVTVPDYDSTAAYIDPYSGDSVDSLPPPSPDSSPPAAPPSSGGTSGVVFTAVQGASPGGMASATVRTTSGAMCSINYYTPSGTDSSVKGLESKTANSNGMVSWSWAIGQGTNRGTGTVTVSCNGMTVSAGVKIG